MTSRPPASLRPLALLVAAIVLAPALVRAASGLGFLDRRENGVAGVNGLNGVRALAIAPDGFNVYTAADKDSAIAVFARDLWTGALVFLEQQRDGVGGIDGLDRARAVAVSPEGTHVYAAGELDDAIAVFARDLLTGRLAFLGVVRDGIDGVDGLDGVKALVVAPDGLAVYAASDQDNAVAAFARDPDTGLLTFVEAQRDNENGVAGMHGAEALAMSPDGGHLYVAAAGDDAIAVFERDWLTGGLYFIERQHDDLDGVDGLDGVRTVVVSPDGNNVYAGGKLDDAVAMFARDPGLGGLTFLGYLRDNVAGVDGLDGVESLDVAPDGSLLYAVSSVDDAVAVFERDSDTGLLTYLHRQRDGLGTLVGLDGPRAVCASVDFGPVYVVASGGDSVLTFNNTCGDGELDAGEQCDDGNTEDGDGCSAGCRRTCVTAADCNDGDACTEERCRLGECATPHCGPGGAVCEVDGTLAALEAVDACFPVDRRLGSTLRQKLRQVRRDIVRLQHRRRAVPAAMITHVERILEAVPRKASRLEQAGILGPDCVIAIQTGIGSLAMHLDQALLRRGLCGS